MKQLLLNLFLISIITMSSFAQVANQPSDLVVCDDDNDGFAVFDLALLDNEVFGAQNPADFNLTYHETQQDADTASNPIFSPYANISTPQTLFIRLEELSTGNFATTTVNLIINFLPNFNIEDVSYCDSSTIILDTGLADNGSYNFVWYFNGTLITDALQATLTVNQTGLYAVEVVDTATGCLFIDSSNVEQFSPPTIIQPTPLEACDDNGDGFASFFLPSKDIEILNGQTGIAITYHETQSDAANATNALPSQYDNITQFSQVIYARLTNVNSDCNAIASLTIEAIICADTNNVNVTTDYTSVESLVENVLLGGDCSQVFNITYSTGETFNANDPNGIGYFSTSDNVFNFNEGLLLSTGDALDASGPNESNGSGSGSSNWLGDSDLEQATGIQSLNATVIEFDFVPVINQISFDFLMASDEYDQGSFECTFSDAFAFLLTDSQGVTTNLAVLPGTNTPISVTNIHPDNGACPAINEAYFGGYIPINTPPIAFNGKTTAFTAQASVNIGEAYHIKLVIADAGDNFFDSGVFLKAGSFDIGELCNDIGLINVKAFSDSNTNGQLDTNEVDFTNGFFTYEKNNDGIINSVNTNIGNFSIVSTDPTDSFTISFNVYDEFAGCYNTTTSSFNGVNVANGSVELLNFPVTDSQVCEDIAVYLINSAEAPRPGFNYENQIIIENLSSVDIASGTIEFIHDASLVFNSVFDLNSNYTLTPISNGFTIDFLNLEAGDSEIISVSLASPTSLDLGTVVTNRVSYVSDSNDLFAGNNTSELSEVVIGSYDPNDKMESHGPQIIFDDFITTDEYLYYTIRFQNLGTAEAIFVKITDVLDAQLDETTFQMLRSSHDYVVTRTGNSLEWFFDDINLPAEQDDPNGSNGFVYFKLKLKPIYDVGDIVSNTASIVFDFNSPIVTNTFRTEFVEPLSVNSFTDKNFQIYPNPASTFVSIEFKHIIEENSKLTIYDLQGKIVTEFTLSNSASLEFNVSNLSSGLYFIKFKTKNKSSIQKLIIQ